MKTQFLLLVMTIALTACGSQESKAIEEYTTQKYMEYPNAKINFEEIRQDSVHTVADSITILYAKYCSKTDIKKVMDDAGYFRDSMTVTAFCDSCSAKLYALNTYFISETKKFQIKVKEEQESIDAVQNYGWTSIMNDLDVDMYKDLNQYKKEINENRQTIKYINNTLPLFEQMKRLDAMNAENILIEFWYNQYTAENLGNVLVNEMRLFQQIRLTHSGDEVIILDNIKLNSRHEVEASKNSTIFDY